MATEADVLRSINAILLSGERKEEAKVDTTLKMMQMAQQQRAQNINIASQQIQVAQSFNTQLQVNVASEFLSQTGLGAYYEQAKPGKRRTKMQSAIDDLVSDKGFSPVVAGGVVTALWSYYEAKDHKSVVKLASDLGTAVDALNQLGKEAPAHQQALFASYSQLGPMEGIQPIARQAMKALSNEILIIKEGMEFLKGDYDIQSDIGVYEDLAEPTDEYLKGGDFLETEEGMQALNDIINASKKDEPWDADATTYTFLGGIYGAQLVQRGLSSEVSNYRSGARDYLKQLARDLKHPAQGGLPYKEFKEAYKTVKGPVMQRDPKAMQKLLSAARQAGWGNTTSVTKATAALKAMQESRFLSRTGKIIGGAAKTGWAAGYFAPMAGRAIGEAVGDELGEAVGGTVGTGVLGAKALSAKMVNKVGDRTKMSFISYLGRKAGAMGGKAAIMAMADSPYLPFGDILAIGYTAIEVVRTYKQWQEYLKN